MCFFMLQSHAHYESGLGTKIGGMSTLANAATTTEEPLGAIFLKENVLLDDPNVMARHVVP
jgi:hypothetical protein